MDAELDSLFQTFVEPDEPDVDRPRCGNCGQPIEFWIELAESTSAGVARRIVVYHIVNPGTRQPHECASQQGQ